jgi:catalase
MTREQRKRLIGNIAGGLLQTPRHIQERQLEHFFKADPAYGEGIAKALGFPVKELAAAR